MDQYGKLHEDMKEGRVLSAYALDRHGLAAAVAKNGIWKRLWR